jgi:hypothetical protein
MIAVFFDRIAWFVIPIAIIIWFIAFISLGSLRSANLVSKLELFRRRNVKTNSAFFSEYYKYVRTRYIARLEELIQLIFNAEIYEFTLKVQNINTTAIEKESTFSRPLISYFCIRDIYFFLMGVDIKGVSYSENFISKLEKNADPFYFDAYKALLALTKGDVNETIHLASDLTKYESSFHFFLSYYFLYCSYLALADQQADTYYQKLIESDYRKMLSASHPEIFEQIVSIMNQRNLEIVQMVNSPSSVLERRSEDQ